jgi:YVTN family beta-propeller protein
VVPIAVQPVHADTVVATVAVGNGPTGVAVNPTTNRIYTSNINDNTVSVINGATNTVVATVDVGDGPIRVAVDPAINHIYVTNYFSDNVSVIDGVTNAVVYTKAVADEPTGVAVNPAINHIYVANYGGTMKNVRVFYDDGFALFDVAVVNLGLGAKPTGVAVNTSTNRIYVADEGDDTVSVFNDNGFNLTFVAKVAVGHSPEGITVNPATNLIYVANNSDDNVSVIDGATNTIVATVAVGDRCWGIAVNPSTNRIYVANEGDNTVSVIDGATNTVVATVAVGDTPTGVAVNPSTNRIYVANEGDDTVSVISDLPPANVTDLTVTEVTTNSVTLSWTAPGNDGNIGTASQYDIRYSTSPITEANWASATQCVGEPAPQSAGTTQTFTVTNLLTGTYYFALKTADETPNWSGLSNVVTANIFTSQTGSRASPTPPRQPNSSNMGTFGLNIGPQAAAPNQPVTIATNVVNTGDEAGNLNVALKINGQLEQSRMVSVGPQGTQPVKFTVSKSQPGTYNVDIGGQKGSFTVLGHGGTARAPLNTGMIAVVIMAVLVLTTAVVLVLTFR